MAVGRLRPPAHTSALLRCQAINLEAATRLAWMVGHGRVREDWAATRSIPTALLRPAPLSSPPPPPLPPPVLAEEGKALTLPHQSTQLAFHRLMNATQRSISSFVLRESEPAAGIAGQEARRPVSAAGSTEKLRGDE